MLGLPESVWFKVSPVCIVCDTGKSQQSFFHYLLLIGWKAPFAGLERCGGNKFIRLSNQIKRNCGRGCIAGVTGQEKTRAQQVNFISSDLVDSALRNPSVVLHFGNLNMYLLKFHAFRSFIAVKNLWPLVEGFHLCSAL